MNASSIDKIIIRTIAYAHVLQVLRMTRTGQNTANLVSASTRCRRTATSAGGVRTYRRNTVTLPGTLLVRHARSHARTHAHTHTRARIIRAHTRKRAHCMGTLAQVHVSVHTSEHTGSWTLRHIHIYTHTLTHLRERTCSHQL